MDIDHRHVIIGLFYGSIFYQLPVGSGSDVLQNRASLFFFSLMFLCLGHAQSVPFLLSDRTIFYHEKQAKLYPTLPYWLSQWLVQVPLVVVNVLLFSICVFCLAGLYDDPDDSSSSSSSNSDSGNRAGADAFGVFFYLLMMASLCGYFTVSLIAAVAPSAQAALGLFPLFFFFNLTFAGYVIALPKFPVWLGSWLPYISFMRYAFQGVILNDFQGNDQHFPNEKYWIDDYLGFHTLSRDTCMGVLVLIAGGLNLLSWLALELFHYEKR